MKLIKTMKLIKAALKREDEYELSYLYGVKLNSFNNIKESKSKYPGLLLQSGKFFRSLLKKTRPFKKKLSENIDVLIFIGSKNQFNSLHPTMGELDKTNVNYVSIAPKAICKSDFDCTLNLFEAFVSFFTFICYAPKLYFRLKKQKKLLEIKYFFSVYCETYIYLPFFISIISTLSDEQKLKLVIVSNDHNNPNRCLRLVCEMLGIKTLYMQHASVSNLFPPLLFDYALLDGEMAYETYKDCLNNLPHASNYPVNIFLSGQKKSVNRQEIKREKEGMFDIGIAVNTLDDFEFLKKIVEEIEQSNFTILIRTHPGQKKEFLNKLTSFNTKHNIEWCNPHQDSLSCFFTSINCLIAANSSIHLEAALAGVPTLYYEFSNNVELPDYYGYIKNGVSFKLNENDLIHSIKEGIEYCNSPFRNKALKRYSETYDTKWESKEGTLSALLIKKLLCNESIDNLFYHHSYDDSFMVYKIKD